MKWLIRIVAKKVITDVNLLNDALDVLASKIKIDYSTKLAKAIFDTRVKNAIQRLYAEYIEGFKEYEEFHKIKN